jgi:glycosyltransferase involved in cell wall biosynthesis
MSGTKQALVYSEYWPNRGGGEKYLLCIVEALLGANCDVTIVAQTASFDTDALSRYFSVHLHGVKIHFVNGGPRTLRQEAKRISSVFDICFYVTNYRFFASRAGHTIAVLQIPYGPIPPVTILSNLFTGKVREAAKNLLRKNLLRKLQTTQRVVVYSKFVQQSLHAAHNVSSTVIEPPIDDFMMDGVQKENIILSVGRFFRGLYNDKRYDVLVEAFKSLSQRLSNTSWQYHLIGSCGPDTASRSHIEKLRAAAAGFPVHFHVNASYDELRRFYNKASIFWHAAGFGVDETRHPESMEHFGMTTVEAMSAGCIPVVINKGGQKEIVTDSESGYLWDTMQELVEKSYKLIGSPARMAAMRTAVRQRFRQYDRQRFQQELLEFIHDLDTHG